MENQPKIIQFSGDGDFCVDTKAFELLIEDTTIGFSSCISFGTLKEIFSTENMEIQLAVVTTCHSNEISEILLQIGIPAVISINCLKQDEEIVQMFLKHVYDKLFNGHCIQEAFNMGVEKCRLENKQDIGICCCAHLHEANCRWYGFVQKHGYVDQTCTFTLCFVFI